MEKTYITFGQIHTHSVNGKTFDKDCLALINCQDEVDGRKRAFEFFKDRFHQQYHEPSEEKLAEILRFFPRGVIEVNPRNKAQEGEIIHTSFLDLQVCVPKDWTDEQVIAFAESTNPCGIERGWQIRREGSKYLNGSLERTQCSDYCGKCHIVLDA